ncbi:ATP-binding protein [Flavisolibacter ginsengisoli]|jgi:PAS domain S-box-containing protein|uniref:histidine kinase n=1 Tax=Flavisolibacter ginsengisoli DSM 18119 TaxID=1121884 RepID=A0A1M5BCZ9_9BACT|nr:ATP-binding protein [Flavisolibacter ginsengisoli]SHF40310.1 CHASE3 domain-containing protein [Flavisolibacter ginsengisoli DSM 18119]
MSKRTFYAFGISFILLIVVIILNRMSFDNMKEYNNAVNHTRNVITLFERLSNHFKSAEIYSPTYDSIPENNFYKLYKNEGLQINGELAELKILVKDNKEQTRLVDSLSTMISGQIYTILQKNIAEIIQSGEAWRLDYLFDIHEIINRGVAHENELLVSRNAKLKDSMRANNIVSVVFALLAVTIIISTFISTLFLSQKRLWLEGFLESVLNTSQNGIVNYKALRKDGVITDFSLAFANKAIETLIGINASKVMGNNIKAFRTSVKDINLFEQYVEVVESGQSSVFEAYFEDGQTQRWLLVSLVKMGDGLTASFQDITQLKKYEEELKDNITQLERSNKELEQYAYVASHDLQEPLRKIRAFGSYLQETQSEHLDEKGKIQLDKIMRSAERMSVLIRDILSFSSMRKEDLYEQTDLNKILEGVRSDFDLTISQTGGSIESNTLPIIEAIPLQMTQLFYNLVNNSFKFAREGVSPQIMITSKELNDIEKGARGLPGESTYYEIKFQDNGIGFSSEYSDQIFGLFKRLNDRQAYPGSGIGLALCKKVIENHNGLIYAKAEENKGACFYIIVPQNQKLHKREDNEVQDNLQETEMLRK